MININGIVYRESFGELAVRWSDVEQEWVKSTKTNAEVRSRQPTQNRPYASQTDVKEVRGEYSRRLRKIP